MPAPLVYYVTRSDRPGQVKIGTTTNLSRRLSQLRSVKKGHSEQVTLVAVEVGNQATERKRHGQFAPMRLDGEWFTFGAPIIAHVMDLEQVPVEITTETHRTPVGVG